MARPKLKSAPAAALWPADAVKRQPVVELIPYAGNARTHSDAQVAQIAESIKAFGFTVPVLIDPAGGTYFWNEKWQTMESSIYGCPEAPKTGPDLPGLIERLRDGNFGVDFEEHGVRGRAEVGLGK